MKNGITTTGSAAILKIVSEQLSLFNENETKKTDLSSRLLAEKISCEIFGPNCWRPRKYRPSEENQESIINTIERYVKLNLPIHCISMGGAAKHYCLSDLSGADFADFMWVRRFVGLQRAVQKVYSPGICVDVFLEDWGEHFLTTLETKFVQSRIDCYVLELQRLSNGFAGSWLKFIPESQAFKGRTANNDFLESIGVPSNLGQIDKSLFLATCNRLSEMFLDYLCETQNAGIVPANSDETCTEHDELPATLALADIGFRGGVPKLQRQHYIERAINCCAKDLEHCEALKHIADYLGTVLCRARLGLLKSLHLDQEGNLPLLKLSLMTQAPGSPKSLERNRIEYVTHDRTRRSGNKTPSWSGWGSICNSNKQYRATVTALHELPDSATCEEVQFKTEAGEICLPVHLH